MELKWFDLGGCGSIVRLRWRGRAWDTIYVSMKRGFHVLLCRLYDTQRLSLLSMSTN